LEAVNSSLRHPWVFSLKNEFQTPFTQPAFFADEMLGRLAKWLRLIGYDTAYAKGIDDAFLVTIAEEQGRILLTRDTLLIRRRRCRHYLFVWSDHWREQLRQVYFEAKLNCQALLTICPVCDYPLHQVRKESVESLIPPYVFQTQNDFSQCDICMRVYWSATHIQRILNELKILKKEH
jgi:uncharacterized protein with PIN domain